MTTGPKELPISLPSWLVHKTCVTIKLWKSSSFQRGFFLHFPDGYTISIGTFRCWAPTVSLSQEDILQLFVDNHILQGHHHHIINRPTSHPSQVSQIFTPPPIPTHDKPLSNFPNRVSYNMEDLRRNLGFRNVENFAHHLKQTSCDTFLFSTLDRKPILDLSD